MFTRELTGLTLTTQVADGMFQNIAGYKFGCDETFVATLRALLYGRVPKGESVFLMYSTSGHGADVINKTDPRDVVRAFLRGSGFLNADVNGNIFVHSFESRDEDCEAAMKVLDENGLNGVLSGYKALEDVATFFKQQGRVDVRVFINEEYKNTIIFVSRMTTKRWHFIQSLIPRYLPWYFRESPLTKEETALVSSLTGRYAPKYEELIEEFAKKFDFRTEMLRNSLRGFETNFERDRLEEIRRQIQRTNDNLDSLNRQFSDYYEKLNDLTTQELGLIEKIRTGGGEESSEILDYFLCNKALELVSVSGSELTFIVNTTLSSFDPDMFESAIRKEESFFYRHYETGRRYANKEMTDERIRRLMIAVFRDELLKIRVCAAYRLNFSTGNYRGISGYDFPRSTLRDHIPNQHIQVYACLGNNEQYIRSAMRKHDYIAALSACGGSAANINFSESNTGTYFMEKIFEEDAGTIIQMPDGSTKTPLDAVKWLEEQDKNENAQEAKGGSYQ